MGIQARAALSCVEERSSARVSGMRRESGEGGDIQTRTEPIRGGSFWVSRAGLNDRVQVRMSPPSPDFLPMLETLMWHVRISLPCILVDVHPYVPLSGLISKVFFLDLCELMLLFCLLARFQELAMARVKLGSKTDAFQQQGQAWYKFCYGVKLELTFSNIYLINGELTARAKLADIRLTFGVYLMAMKR
ncbi:hypothetical protein CRG98_017059 [Punica granatum]|uniref:Uncharacterized protein n=1 Tax=Punica granatum TaxID=22663 RepID=A0A2I0K1V8_PUNGR|nr:hypothetical protein CRG98_017059 [Punica granatum]